MAAIGKIRSWGPVLATVIGLDLLHSLPKRCSARVKLQATSVVSK